MFKRTACPVCDETYNISSLVSLPFSSEKIRYYLDSFYCNRVDHASLAGYVYEVMKCNSCDCLYQTNVPSDSLSHSLYTEWINTDITKINHLNKPLSSFLWYAQEISTVISVLKKNPSDVSILDFGMGWGQWSSMARSFGCNVIGIERSPVQIKNANQIGISCRTDISELRNFHFDFINTEQVLEHVDSPMHILTELSSLLKPNGILKISVPYSSNPIQSLNLLDFNIPKNKRHSLNFIAPLEHINYFNPKTFSYIADRLRLKSIKLPMNIQYRSAMFLTGGTASKHILKCLLFPIWRNILNRGNYILLQKSNLS